MSTYHFVALLRRKSLLRLREIYYTRRRPHWISTSSTNRPKASWRRCLGHFESLISLVTSQSTIFSALSAAHVDSRSTRLLSHRKGPGWPRYHSRRINWGKVRAKETHPRSDAQYRRLSPTFIRYLVLAPRPRCSTPPRYAQPPTPVYEVICFPERAKFCR